MLAANFAVNTLESSISDDIFAQLIECLIEFPQVNWRIQAMAELGSRAIKQLFDYVATQRKKDLDQAVANGLGRLCQEKPEVVDLILPFVNDFTHPHRCPVAIDSLEQSKVRPDDVAPALTKAFINGAFEASREEEKIKEENIYEDIYLSAAKALPGYLDHFPDVGTSELAHRVARVLPPQNEGIQIGVEIQELAMQILADICNANRERTLDKITEQLLECLSDMDALVRAPAADALGQIGTERAVEGLVESLKDEDDGTAGNAAQALGQIKQASPPVINGLINTLSNHPAETVAVNAAEALREIGTASPPVIDVLISALQNPAETVQIAAAKALGLLAPESNDMELNQKVRVALVTLIGGEVIINTHEVTADATTSPPSSTQRDDKRRDRSRRRPLKAQSAADIRKELKSKSIDEIKEDLERPWGGCVAQFGWIIEAFKELGSFDEVWKGFENINQNVRQPIEALKPPFATNETLSLQVTSIPFEEAGGFVTPSDGVKRAALKALARRWEHLAIQQLSILWEQYATSRQWIIASNQLLIEELNKRGELDNALEALKGHEQSVLETVIEQLRSFPPPGEEHRAQVISIVKNKNQYRESVREEAVTTLSQWKKVDEQIVNLLLETLQNRDEYVGLRSAAADAFGEWDSAPPEAISRLAQAFVLLQSEPPVQSEQQRQDDLREKVAKALVYWGVNKETEDVKETLHPILEIPVYRERFIETILPLLQPNEKGSDIRHQIIKFIVNLEIRDSQIKDAINDAFLSVFSQEREQKDIVEEVAKALIKLKGLSFLYRLEEAGCEYPKVVFDLRKQREY